MTAENLAIRLAQVLKYTDSPFTPEILINLGQHYWGVTVPPSANMAELTLRSLSTPENISGELRCLTQTIIDADEVNSDSLFEDLSNHVQQGLFDRLNQMLNEREREVLISRLGSGGRPLTLEEIGGRFKVTRERIRQIEKKAVRRMDQQTRHAIESHQDWRFQQKLITGAFRSLSSRAGEDIHSVDHILDDVTKNAGIWPIGTRLAVDPRLANIRVVVNTILDDHAPVWLDDRHDEFIKTSAKNPYTQTARKLLALYSEVDIGAVHDGIVQSWQQRSTRRSLRLSEAELGILLSMFDFEISGRVVTLGTHSLQSGLDPQPTEPEWTIITTLQQEQGVSTLEILRSRIPELRRNNSTMSQVLMGKSPLFERLGPSVYGLRGSSYDPEKVSALVREAEINGHPWVNRAGWDDDQSEDGSLSFRLPTRGQLPSTIGLPESVVEQFCTVHDGNRMFISMNCTPSGRAIPVSCRRIGNSVRLEQLDELWPELGANLGDYVEFRTGIDGTITVSLSANGNENIESITIDLGRGWTSVQL